MKSEVLSFSPELLAKIHDFLCQSEASLAIRFEEVCVLAVVQKNEERFLMSRSAGQDANEGEVTFTPEKSLLAEFQSVQQKLAEKLQSQDGVFVPELGLFFADREPGQELKSRSGEVIQIPGKKAIRFYLHPDLEENLHLSFLPSNPRGDADLLGELMKKYF